MKKIKATNWNQQWENNYPPVIVENEVAVRAIFHQPNLNVKHEIIITPKMSFGTGHHATTYKMIEKMEGLDFKNKTVLDFGTGTAVLAILAEKMAQLLLMLLIMTNGVLKTQLKIWQPIIALKYH